MTTDADLQAPFIAPDGLEYGCFADFLVQEPLQTWRNEHIQAARAEGRSEALIRKWVEAYDGYDKRTTPEITEQEQVSRHVAANFACDSKGKGLNYLTRIDI